MRKHCWSPIEERDDADVVCAVHIMPIVMTEGFATEKEAWDFLQQVEAAGCPCLTDEEGTIVSTYFGHTVKANCSCSPELRRDALLPTYIHRMTQ